MPLQFKIAQEDTKYGFDLESAEALLQSADYQSFGNINIIGVMGMATFTEDENQVRQEFKRLKEIFNVIHAAVWGKELRILRLRVVGRLRN